MTKEKNSAEDAPRKIAKPKKRKDVMRLKLNAALRGHDAGSTIRIKSDGHGVPVDSYWRRRLKDAVHDNCVEVAG